MNKNSLTIICIIHCSEINFTHFNEILSDCKYIIKEGTVIQITKMDLEKRIITLRELQVSPIRSVLANNVFVEIS